MKKSRAHWIRRRWILLRWKLAEQEPKKLAVFELYLWADLKIENGHVHDRNEKDVFNAKLMGQFHTMFTKRSEGQERS